MGPVLRTSATFLTVTFLAAAPTGAQQPYVRVQRLQTQPADGSIGVSATPASAPLAATSNVCDETARAWHGQPVPGGGTLMTVAYGMPATIAGQSRIAFYARVNGSPRNQGVFVGDGVAVQPIAVGSGAGGGSGSAGTGVGDATPIGGRFTGFFGSTPFCPATNASGDVLFIADVDGGSAPRGLFLYRASTQTLVKIAAVGDTSPTGATLTEIGPGSINAAGVVVFLASRTASFDNEILRWQNGVLTKIAAVGDLAPSGGVYQYVGGEYFGFTDGTNIPTGPVPDINDAGTICFRGIATSSRGVVVIPSGGSPQWYVRDFDATPHGGTYAGIWGAILNNADQVAFYSDVVGAQSGWFVGKPGAWRKALVFFDVLDVGACIGLAVSRNPMQPLNDAGDLVLWANEYLSPTQERDWLVVSRADGLLERVAGKGDATALGGTIGGMDAWPSMNAIDECTLNCGTPGAPGVVSAHFLDTLCLRIGTYCTAGISTGNCIASMTSSGTPSASATAGFDLRTFGVDGQRSGIVFYGVSGRLDQPWGAGSTSFLCVKSPTQRTGLQNSGGTVGACDGTFMLDFNAYRAANATALGQPMLAGQRFDAQSWYRDPGAPKNTNLSNAIEFELAP